MFFASVKRLFEFFFWHVGASEVHHDIQSVILQSINTNLQSLVCSRATCTPSDINPHWIQRSHTIKSLVQVLYTKICLRGEVLEGKPWDARLLLLPDLEFL